MRGGHIIIILDITEIVNSLLGLCCGGAQREPTAPDGVFLLVGRDFDVFIMGACLFVFFNKRERAADHYNLECRT